MRIYNPSLGRFLSVDPLTKKFPYYTPYQFAGNKPLACIDIDGLEDIYYNDPRLTKSQAYNAAISILTSTDTYKEFQNKLKSANGDIVIAPMDYAGTETDPNSGYHVYGVGGEAVFIGVDEMGTNDTENAEKRGVNIDRSRAKGRDVIVVYIDLSLLQFADKAISDAEPKLYSTKDLVPPMLSNVQITQNSIEEIANTIAHELYTHGADELDKKDDIPTEQEHINYYGLAPYSGRNAMHPHYSPLLNNVDPKSFAGKVKQEINNKSLKVVINIIQKTTIK